MIITKIEIQKNNKEKVNIFVDEKYSFSLSMNGLTKNNLYDGKEISKEDIEFLKKVDSEEIAFLFLIDKISYKMYSKKEIKDKMIAKGFELEAIENAIEKAEGYGYINDNYYSKCFIEQRGIPNKWGPNVIYQKLLQKGIDKEIINENLKDFFTYDDEKENCRNLAIKKINSLKINDLNDRKQMDKVYRFLIGKGYSFEIINVCLEDIRKDF